MIETRGIATAVLALLAAGCASLPQPPLQYTLRLAPSALTIDAERTAGHPLKVHDARNVTDPLRIGEVYAPAGGKPPPVVPGPAAPAVAGAILLLPTEPTGRYLVVANAGGVPEVIEHALKIALKKRPSEGDTFDATIRTFWIRPSWTTSCDIVVDLRRLDPNGAPLWRQTIETHVDRFEGWFTVEAFERVGRLALDEFIRQAADIAAR